MEVCNGLGMNPGNLSRLSHAQSRSISAESQSGGEGNLFPSDQLHPDGRPGGPCLLSCAVPAGQSAALQGGLYDSGSGQGPRPLFRNRHGPGNPQ